MNEGRKSGNKYMEEALPLLKKIVDQNGVGYLHKKPYSVYTKLKSQKTDLKICRVVLVSILADASEYASKMDQKECCLKKSAADQVAEMWTSLFGRENLEEWEKNTGQGLRDFCDGVWEYSWSGDATWHYGGGHVDCWCSGMVKIEVSDEEKVQREIATLLKENPFVSEEKIYDYYDDILGQMLDEGLEYYVTCEEYYEPVMEDYDGSFQDAAEKFCEKYGFSLVGCECDGDASDYEPDHDRYGW